jgi:hypothetical protein
MAHLRGLGSGRVGVALVPAGVGAALGYALLNGLGVGPVVATGLPVTVAVAGTLWLSSHLPADLNGALHRHTGLAILWLVVGLGAIGTTARLATFMVDETKTDRSMLPFDDFFVHHSCLSAHFQSARLHRDGVANVYERTNFEGPNGEPKLLRSFVIDVFLYPPPFLLLSRLGLALSEDFATWRAVWFGLEGAIVAAGLLAIGLSIGGSVGRLALLLSPLVWLSVPLLTTLQFGNFHLVAIAGSMLAMLALNRGRHAVGGALLAALVLAKIFPGILVLLLMFQRRWRSVAWTAGFGLILLGVSWAVLGDAPFRAMVSYNLPRLSSGAALETQFAHPDAIAASHSIFGLVQKLSLLGVPGMSQPTAVAAAWMYTAALFLFAALGARASDEPLSRALVWLALLQLASLRSPFTPDTYAQVPLLWILVLLLASIEWRSWRVVALLGLVILANYIVPTVPIMPLPVLLGISVVHQLLFLGLCIGLLVAQRRRGVTPMGPQAAVWRASSSG